MIDVFFKLQILINKLNFTTIDHELSSLPHQLKEEEEELDDVSEEDEGPQSIVLGGQGVLMLPFRRHHSNIQYIIRFTVL